MTLLEFLEPRYLMAAGDFDANFGVGGIVSRSPAETSSAPAVSVESMFVEPDGSTLLAIRDTPPVAGAFKWFNQLLRFRANGTPDPAFGNGGAIPLGDADVTADQILAQPDGKILVMVNARRFLPVSPVRDSPPAPSISYGLVYRFDASGSLDQSFGHGGIVLLFSYYGDYGFPAIGGMALDHSGNVFVAGSNTLFSSSTMLQRLTPAGRLDRSFGNKGTATVPLGFTDILPILKVLDDGKILLANKNGAISRVNEDGTIDTSFGINGLVDQSQWVPLAAVDPDGGIVQCPGSIDSLVRFNPDGTLDSSFSPPNPTMFSGFFPSALTVDSAGRVLVALSQGDTAPSEVIRLLPNGSLDPLFGSGGQKLLAPSTASFSRIISTDDQIVVGGATAEAATLIRLDASDVFPPLPSSFLGFGANAISIHGTPGDDLIDVDYSVDHGLTVTVNGESTSVFGLPNRLVVSGGDGNDTIRIDDALSSSLIFPGQNINATPVGYRGTHFGILLGGNGDDTLEDDFGIFTLIGGPGNDTLKFGHVMIGGAGNDSLTARNFVSPILDAIFPSPYTTNWLFGGPGNDSLVGGFNRNIFDGGPGDDTIIGDTGGDIVLG